MRRPLRRSLLSSRSPGSSSSLPARDQVGKSAGHPGRKAAIKTEGGPVDGGWNLWSDGKVGQYVQIPSAGTYTIIIRAWGSPAAKVWPEMALLVDELEVKSVTVDRDRPADYRFEAALKEGRHEVAAAFLNDGRSGKEDRNLYLERITIVAPPGADAPAAVFSKERPRDRGAPRARDRRGDRAGDRQEPEIRRGRPRGRLRRSGRSREPG